MASEYTIRRAEVEEAKNKKKGWMISGKNLIQRRTTKQLIEDALLTRFQDQRTRQEKNRREFFAKKVQELLILRTQQRDIIFEKFHASMHEMKLKEQYATAMQRALRASWHNILGLQFFAEQKDDKWRMRMESSITHFDKAGSEEAAKDIAEFETKTGFELGAEGPADAAPVGGKKPPPPPPKKMSKTAIKPVEEPFLPDPKVLKAKRKEEEKAAMALIVEIKNRKFHEFADKLEVLKKQRQDMLEEQEQHRAKDEEEAMKKSEEDSVLQAAQAEEEAEKKRLLEEEQKVAQDAWLAQQQELQKKNLADYNLIRAQEHECYMMFFNDRADEINEEYNRRQADIQAKRKKRWQKHYDFCFDIVLQFVSMAECVNEYRLEIGKNLPAHEFRQWKNLFIKGALLPAVLPRPPTSVEPPSEKELRLAKEEAEAYMDEKGEYSNPEGVEATGKNKELGKFLVDIDGLTESLAEPFERPDLSKFTLMISVVGVSNAGKTTVAKHVEGAYGILRIEIKQVQDLAVTFATAEEERIKAELATQPPTDESNASKDGEKGDPLDKLSDKVRLGFEARSAIANNTQVPDDVIAHLLLLTMLHPEEYVPTAPTDPPAGKAPPPAKKKSVKGAAPAAVPAQQLQSGFVLDGFPQTRGQAAALEKLLTGIDFEAREAKKAKASKIAPPPEPQVVQQEKSGLDAYLVIEAPPEDELLKRLSGSLVDPTTVIIYHPLTNPVPAGDKTGIAERLQPVESEEAILAKIAAAGEVFRNCSGILSMFDNVHSVPQHHDESGGMTPDIEKAMAAVTGLIDGKAKEGAIHVATETAKSSVEVATQAFKEVEMASNAAKEMAKVFFNAKLAEVEAEQAAAPIANSSDAIVKMLDEVTKAVQEAQDAAAASSAAAELAQKHAQDSQTVEGGPEGATLCKEEAKKALQVAKEAAIKATAASEKTSLLLETAKALAAGLPPPPPPPPPPTEKSAPTEVVKPPPDPVVVEKAKTAELVHKTWEELEKEYLQTIQEGFRLLIHERERTIPLLIEAKRDFIALLKQDNGKQDFFEEFQERWNRVELDHRRDKLMKKRMREGGSRFGEVLRTLARERLQNGKAVEQRSLEDFLDERTATFTSIFSMLAQAELDRHTESCGLLHEYYTKRVGSQFSRQFRCNLTTARGQPTWRFVPPKWLTPLEGSYPEFHAILSEALAKAGNLLDVIAGRSSGGPRKHPRRPITRRMSGHRMTWMREEVLLDPDVKPAIAREHQIFCHRLELLARFACKYLADLQPVCDGAWGNLDAWLVRRCDEEHALVEEVRAVIMQAAEGAIPLWYRMWMQPDDFTVEEDEITTIVRVPPEPIIDLTPWHIKVMESITKTFKIFNGGFAKTQEVIKTTLSAIDEVYIMWRNLPEHSIYSRLPRYRSRRYGHFQHWANLIHDIVQQSCGEKDPRLLTVIEWRGFLVSLVDAQFDYIISAATVDDIIQARIDFFMVVTTKQPGDPSEGCITLDDFLGIKMWFDKSNFEGGSSYSDDTESDKDAAKEDKFDLPRSIKMFVYSVLGISNQHVQSGLPWQTLLLYLCRDACQETALRKVFTVLCSTMSPNEAQLNPTELIQAMYPSGVDGAIEAGCLIWTINNMQDVLFRAGIEKATPFVEPCTFGPHVSSDSEPQHKKGTISQFFDNRSSSHESHMGDAELDTIQEFLYNMPDTVPTTECTGTPWQESEEELQFVVQPDILERLTVEDCMKLNATAKLCDALAATFRQHSVNIMQIAPAEEGPVHVIK